MREADRIDLHYWVAALFAAIALMGIAALLSDKHPHIAWGCAVAGTTLALAFFLRAIWLANGRDLPQSRMVPFIGMAISGVVFVGCAAWFFWPTGAKEIAGINRPYHTLSNFDLKQQVLAFSKTIRDFEFDFDKSNPGPPEVNLPIITEEQIKTQNAKWKIFNEALQARWAEKTKLFNERYLTKARELKDELWSRLKIKEWERPNSKNIYASLARGPLDFGQLAGVKPISNVAAYLEQLADSLQ